MKLVLDPLAIRLGRRSAIRGSLRWVIFAFTLAPVRERRALAQEPSRVSAVTRDVGATPQSNVDTSANVPAVARLWDELLCTCGESDCARPTLSRCGCEYAQKERQRIADEVRRLGFGTRERDDVTYATLFRAYTAKHGSDATLAARAPKRVATQSLHARRASGRTCRNHRHRRTTKALANESASSRPG
jgi:hypothetical protein